MKKPLGRGLSSLIGEQFGDEPTTCPIEAIVPNPHQPRINFDEVALQELSQSILEHGIMNPLLVRSGTEGQYILIAGERRLRAAKIAGLTTVPIRIQAVTDRGSLELAIVENVQREDINPLESAQAYRRLIDEFELTQEEVSKRVGKSRTAIANQLRLLNLPPRIQSELGQGSITEGHARALLSANSSPVQIALLDRIIKERLSVRETEAICNRQRADKSKTLITKSKIEPEIAIIEEQLSEVYGCPVTIQTNPQSGKITFMFFGNDDLSRILDELLKKAN